MENLLHSTTGHHSPTKKYRKTLTVEIFDNLDQGVYEKKIDPYNEIKCQMNSDFGNIVNSICIKLLRGDDNYNLMLENIVNHIINIFCADIGSISVAYQNKNNIDNTKVICLALAERISGILHPFNEGEDMIKDMSDIFEHSVITDKVIVSNDLSTDSRFTRTINERQPNIKNLIVVPLKYQNDMICLLSVANRRGGNYSFENLYKLSPFLELCTSLTMKSLDSRKTLVSKIQKINEKDAEKDKFLATMSHELRTPLNGIMGMVTLFPDSGPLNTKQKEYIKNLTECTVKLTGLLNNFLDFTKMSSDRLSLNKQPFIIEDVINDSVRIIEGNKSAKNLDLKIDIDKKIPSLIGDKQRIVQILSNLLSNAVKFTEKGFIQIKVGGTALSEKKIGRASKWKIFFLVKDTGLGIPREEQEKIFEVFYQSTNLSSYLSHSGTGLGLSITKELIRLMGGKLSVSSDGIPGRGSSFDFYIIVDEEIDMATIKREHIKKLTGSHVLVVDDRAEMRIQISELLFKWKCIPQAVSSAAEALQYLQYGMKFKAALIDINMPQMSGIELAQELRSKYPFLPLVGISSIKVAGGESYFDYYMYKPIDQNTLFPALLQCIIKPKRVSKLCGDKKLRKSKRNLKILVAEDDHYNRFTIRELLLSIGYKRENIVIVNDGIECVEQIKNSNFDVILMDIVMPGMDGVEVSQKIKRLKNPPMIIAVSAAVQPSDKTKCQNAGIDCYLSKPIVKEKLNSALFPLIKKSSRINKTKERTNT